jgi:hypothetical protein
MPENEESAQDKFIRMPTQEVMVKQLRESGLSSMTHEGDTVFRLLLRQIAEEEKSRTEPVNALEQANHEAHRDKPLGLDLTITRFLNAYVFDQEIEANTHDPEVGTEVKAEL